MRDRALSVLEARALVKVYIIGGLDSPTAGQVRHGGQDLARADDAALTTFRREHVGFVFQFYGVEEQRVVVVVDLVDAPQIWARLGDGWRVQARITTWAGTVSRWRGLGGVRGRSAAGPAAADRDRSSQRRRRRGVAGLGPGDRVLIHPSERVADGIEIEPR